MQEDLIFENIYFEGDVQHLIRANSPINSIKLINSVLRDSDILLNTLDEDIGIKYGHTDILMSGTTFKGATDNTIVACDGDRTVSVRIMGSGAGNDFHPKYRGNVEIISSDIEIEKE